MRAFTFFIPRSIWSDKPEPVTVIVGEMLGFDGVSIVSTFIGEAYLNFGWFALVFFPIFIPVLSRAFGYLLGELAPAFGFFVGFLMFRLPIADVLIMCFVALAINFFLRKLSRKTFVWDSAGAFSK